MQETHSTTIDAQALRRLAKRGHEQALNETVAALDNPDALEQFARLLVRYEDKDRVSTALTSAILRYMAIAPDNETSEATTWSLMRRARKEGLAAASKAFAAGDDRPMIARFALEAAVHRGDGVAAIGIGTALLDRLPITEHTLVAARQLLHIGARQHVVDWIQRVKQTGTADGCSPKIQELLQDLDENNPRDTSEHNVVVVHKRPGAKRVVFAFCGLHNRFGVPDADLVEWMTDIDAHLVILRDPELLLYLKGLAALGVDMKSTADALLKVARDLGSAEILCIGSSAGGYAAIRYGLLMGASRVMVFGGLTLLTKAAILADGRAVGVVQRLLAEVEHELADCRELLEARSKPLPVVLYYGEDMMTDRRQAEHVQGVEGIVLHQIPALKSHRVVAHLAEEGQMVPILSDFVGKR